MKRSNAIASFGVALLCGACLGGVTVTATADADEGKGRNGAFRIARDAADSCARPLTVRFTVGGTAKPGRTYCSLWGDVQIPKGRRDVTLPIRPLDDPATTADATVTLTLAADASYALGATRTATVTIRNGATYGGHLAGDAGPGNLLAHKANSGNREFPENTLAATKFITAAGYAFENDVQISKSGVLYLGHDATQRDYPADWPDSFSEVLKILPKGAVCKVDAKCGTAGLERLLEEVRKSGAHKRALIAFNCLTAHSARIHRELPGTQIWAGEAFRTKDPVTEANRVVAYCRASGAEGVSLHWDERVCTDEFFAILHRAHITADMWTIDNPRVAKEAINRGARYVTTNRPVPIAAAFPKPAR